MLTRFTTRSFCHATLAVGAALAIGSFAQAGPTTHVVELAGFDFTPAEIEIEVGDTVQWLWVEGLHDVTSGASNGIPDGNFSSGSPVENPGMTFEVTFDQAFLDENPMPENMYPYFCSVHVDFGMVGTVTVNAGGSACMGDLNTDDTVNGADLGMLLGNWGGKDVGDLNDSGEVNGADLGILLGNWGECPE